MLCSGPKQEEIEQIRNWDITKTGVKPLIDFIKTLWVPPVYGITVHKYKHSVLRIPVYRVTLQTFGYQGNEKIIKALKNSTFWLLCWLRSERGGRFWFEVPEHLWEIKK